MEISGLKFADGVIEVYDYNNTNLDRGGGGELWRIWFSES